MSKEINILIVEDEFITLDNLIDVLQELGYNISGGVMNVEEALRILERGNTDLVILDIHLKGAKTGISLAQQINQHYQIPFIFLSAYSDRSTVSAATQTQPAGYLVKPFTKATIFTAIEVAINTYNHKVTSIDFIEKDRNASIFIKEDKVYKKIYLNDIQYIEAFKNYLELHLVDKRHVIRSTLKNFMRQLPEADFFQTHRSFAINKQHIESVSTDTILVSGVEIPISRSMKERFFKWLKLD